MIDTNSMDSLVVFPHGDTALQVMANKVRGLVVAGVDDKAGLKAVRDARLSLRRARIEIENDRKKLLENAIGFQRKVNAEAKRLVAFIEPTEIELQAEEDRIDAEKKRLEREEAERARKAEAERIAAERRAHEAKLEEERAALQRERDALAAERAALEAAKPTLAFPNTPTPLHITTAPAPVDDVDFMGDANTTAGGHTLLPFDHIETVVPPKPYVELVPDGVQINLTHGRHGRHVESETVSSTPTARPKMPPPGLRYGTCCGTCAHFTLASYDSGGLCMKFDADVDMCHACPSYMLHENVKSVVPL